MRVRQPHRVQPGGQRKWVSLRPASIRHATAPPGSSIVTRPPPVGAMLEGKGSRLRNTTRSTWGGRGWGGGQAEREDWSQCSGGVLRLLQGPCRAGEGARYHVHHHGDKRYGAQPLGRMGSLQARAVLCSS